MKGDSTNYLNSNSNISDLKNKDNSVSYALNYVNIEEIIYLNNSLISSNKYWSERIKY